eukprot:NODE_345_length_9042_cov_0.258973.p7 type:complete len:173 gc:universal NODE_345_length_9042_cov_0.258973:6832-7350(+)
MEEPKCCCCGVRLGLSILYLLVLIGGILNFVAGAGSIALGSGTSGALSIVQGVLYVIGAIVGFASITTQKVKVAAAAMWIYVVMITINIIIYIISLAMVSAAVDDAVAQEKAANPDFTDDQVNALKSVRTSAIIASGAVGIGLTLLIGGLIVQRMYLYKKWLAEKEGSAPSA